MSDLKNSEIIALLQKVAATHTLIGHDPDNALNRFYGFNPEQLLVEERSELNFDTLVMGLGLPDTSIVSWNFKVDGTATQKLKYFDVCVLGKFEAGDYEAEDEQCEDAEQVLQDLQTWLFKTANSAAKCNWPVVELLDLSNMQCRRVSMIANAELSGAVMRLTLRDYVMYNAGSNPLNAMTP